MVRIVAEFSFSWLKVEVFKSESLLVPSQHRENLIEGELQRKSKHLHRKATLESRVDPAKARLRYLPWAPYWDHVTWEPGKSRVAPVGTIGR